MTTNEIREIVKIVLDELEQRKQLKEDNYRHILQVVEPELKRYFKKEKNTIDGILKQLSDDAYIDVIYLHYRDNYKLEFIAEVMSRDVSTIKRNKKRLIKKIYELQRWI